MIDILMTIICIASIIGLFYSIHKLIELVILKYAEWIACNHHELMNDYSYTNNVDWYYGNSTATKVEKSNIYGNVKINGEEVMVFDHFVGEPLKDEGDMTEINKKMREIINK